MVLWRPQFDDEQNIDVIASMAQLQDIQEAITNYLRRRPQCSVYLAIAPWQPFDMKLYQQLFGYLTTRFSAFPQCRLFRLTPDELPEGFESGVYKHDAIFDWLFIRIPYCFPHRISLCCRFYARGRGDEYGHSKVF